MITTFRLPADELNNTIIKSIKDAFKGRSIEITVSDSQLSEIKSKHSSEKNGKPALHKFTRPLFETTDLKRIAASQNYRGTDAVKINELAAQLNIRESLGDLLKMLRS